MKHHDGHQITGERSWHMDSFNLKEHDVDEHPFRNFPGVESEAYYDMEDLRNGDWSGSTDTDMPTEDHKYVEKTKDHSRSKGKENPYSKVNQTMGKHLHVPIKNNTPRVKNPNKKPVGIKDPLMRGKARGR